MEWNIQLPSKTCANCAGQFGDKDPCHSVLAMNNVELIRRDYCAACFEGIREQAKSDAGSAYWKTVYKLVLPPPKVDPVKKDKVESLLRAYLAGEIDDETKKICYLLAVMLERKRVLKHLKTFSDTQNDKRVLAYQHAKTGESFAIPDPGLAMTEIPQLQARVKELLDTMDRPPAAPMPADPPPTPQS
ncbi:MAG TPA: hypothetical protein P5287_00930 [bacterium]|nr:hypothetical protein [bacterium]